MRVGLRGTLCRSDSSSCPARSRVGGRSDGRGRPGGGREGEEEREGEGHVGWAGEEKESGPTGWAEREGKRREKEEKEKKTGPGQEEGEK